VVGRFPFLLVYVYVYYYCLLICCLSCNVSRQYSWFFVYTALALSMLVILREPASMELVLEVYSVRDVRIVPVVLL